MGHDELDVKVKVEEFASEFDLKADELLRFLSFLNVSEEDAVIFKGVIGMIKNKKKAIKNIESLSDANEILKVNKILKKYHKK